MTVSLALIYYLLGVGPHIQCNTRCVIVIRESFVKCFTYSVSDAILMATGNVSTSQGLIQNHT